MAPPLKNMDLGENQQNKSKNRVLTALREYLLKILDKLSGPITVPKTRNPKIRPDVRPGVRPGVRPDVRPDVRAAPVSSEEKKKRGGSGGRQPPGQYPSRGGVWGGEAPQPNSGVWGQRPQPKYFEIFRKFRKNPRDLYLPMHHLLRHSIS